METEKIYFSGIEENGARKGGGIFGEGKSITEKEKEGQNSGNRSVLARFPDPLASKRGSGNLARSVLDGQ